jgi:hypothetical protein
MSTLLEIETAAEKLPPEEKQALLHHLAAHLGVGLPQSSAPQARLVRRGGDVLLEAPPGAPPMTPQSVKRMLEDWP